MKRFYHATLGHYYTIRKAIEYVMLNAEYGIIKVIVGFLIPLKVTVSILAWLGNARGLNPLVAIAILFLSPLVVFAVFSAITDAAWSFSRKSRYEHFEDRAEYHYEAMEDIVERERHEYANRKENRADVKEKAREARKDAKEAKVIENEKAKEAKEAALTKRNEEREVARLEKEKQEKIMIEKKKEEVLDKKLAKIKTKNEKPRKYKQDKELECKIIKLQGPD